MKNSPLHIAIHLVGGQSELARRLGVWQSVVSYWARIGTPPPERCRAIEAATGGQVTRYQLRPDVFGEGPEETPAPGME